MPSPSLFAANFLSMLEDSINAKSQDLTIRCARGKKLSVSSELFVKHSDFFKALIKGSFAEAQENNGKKLSAREVQLSDFSEKTLSSVQHFFKSKELPQDRSFTKRDLCALDAAIDYLMLPSEEESREYKTAVSERVKKECLNSRDKAISWYKIACDLGDSKASLKMESLDALKGPVTSAEFLSTIASAKKTLRKRDLFNFFCSFVRFCTIDYTNCDLEQKKEIFSILKQYGMHSQVLTCMNAIVGDVADADLFTVLKGEAVAKFEAFSESESRNLCVNLLVPRLKSWLKEVSGVMDFKHSEDTLRGVKSGSLGSRKELPHNAKVNLNQFIKIAPRLKGEELLLDMTEDLSPRLQTWTLSKINKI